MTGGPGIWDAIPPHDDEADKFEDALLRFKVESFFEFLSFIIVFSSYFELLCKVILRQKRGILFGLGDY